MKHTLFFDYLLTVLCTHSFAYQLASCSNYHHMYVTVLVWVKIQFDWNQIPFKYKTRKKKNRWKQWQRESAEKIRENA